MEIRRFFVNPQDICANGEIVVSGDEFAHMTKVLRYKVGYKAIVCANDGIERLCTIKQIDKDSAVLTCDEQNLQDKKHVHITLYAGLLKNNKLDFAVQKRLNWALTKCGRFCLTTPQKRSFQSTEQTKSLWRRQNSADRHI